VHPGLVLTAADLAGSALANARRFAATFDEARMDPLTGVGNHRAFHERLDADLRAAASNGADVGLVLFDLDDFKRVNDVAGHQAGDRLLRDFARIASGFQRQEEELFRLGGDEFAIVVDGDGEAGATVADRVRTAVAAECFASSLTVSAGVASFPADARTKDELLHKADVVYHLAAAVGVKTIVEQPVRTLRVNLEGTETVLDACCRFDKPVLVASTSEVYGDHRSEEPLRETSRRIYGATTQKRWAYADSKAMDEFLALAYHEEHDLQAVIVRLFNTVGPRQTGMYGMVIPRFVERALSGAPIEIYGDGLQTRCFCHVDDTIRALRDLMTDLERTAGEIFNVGANNQISILGLADQLTWMTGSTSPKVHIPFSEVYGTGIEDMLHRVPCTDKVRDTIGWVPKHSLADILGDVIAEMSARAKVAA
jgi:UDP-glucose 4-epimerase